MNDYAAVQNLVGQRPGRKSSVTLQRHIYRTIELAWDRCQGLGPTTTAAAASNREGLTATPLAISLLQNVNKFAVMRWPDPCSLLSRVQGPEVPASGYRSIAHSAHSASCLLPALGDVGACCMETKFPVVTNIAAVLRAGSTIWGPTCLFRCCIFCMNYAAGLHVRWLPRWRGATLVTIA